LLDRNEIVEDEQIEEDFGHDIEKLKVLHGGTLAVRCRSVVVEHEAHLYD
jgi:hypothetical protein